MGKIGLIIKREFSTRVRKKTFIVLTILGPILSAAIFILPAYLATMPDEQRVITVLDESLLLDFEKGNDKVKLRYLPPDKFDSKLGLEFSQTQEDYAFLHVPLSDGGDPDFLANNIKLYRAGDVSISVENYLENQLEKYLQNEKLKATGVDPGVISQTKTKVNIRTINTDAGAETENATFIKIGIGYVASFLIYLFIFLYGAQVMRGVIEEKTNRIMEVIVSSVKPFQLMAGKIIGIACVALLQFTVWVVFAALIYLSVMHFFLADAIDPAQLSQGAAPNIDPTIFKMVSTLSTINFPLIIGAFIFYFLGGYLLYGAFFAAVGSAVDKESDSSQFSLPVSIPLILSIIVVIRALDSPDSTLAFWFSMVPFTSPIVMMARIPFGIAPWELLLSMFILLVSIVGATWGAGKIYRTGILMYGKKPKFTELFRWLKH